LAIIFEQTRSLHRIAISANSLSFHEKQPHEKYWPYPIACIGIFKLFSHGVQSWRWHLQLKQAIVRAAVAQTIMNYLTGSVARKYMCALFAVSAASSEFQLNATLEILSIEHTAAGDLYNAHINAFRAKHSKQRLCASDTRGGAHFLLSRGFSCSCAAVTFIPR